MPVIPYTIRAACLWREFGLRTTLSTHRTKRQMKRSRVITLALVVAVIALFFYMSTARANQERRVCVEFQGQSNCAPAAGSTAAEATQTAHTTACGPVAHGMNETIACGNRAPVSVQCDRRR